MTLGFWAPHAGLRAHVATCHLLVAQLISKSMRGLVRGKIVGTFIAFVVAFVLPNAANTQPATDPAPLGIALPRLEQSDADPTALVAEVERLRQAGKYPEAAEIAKRVLAVSEEILGREHPALARC